MAKYLYLYLILMLSSKNNFECRVPQYSDEPIKLNQKSDSKETNPGDYFSKFPEKIANEREVKNLSFTNGDNKDLSRFMETNQSTGQNEDCFFKTINPILDLLEEFGMIYNEKNVEYVSFYANKTNLDEINLTHMIFIISLSIKELIPSDLDKKIFEKVYTHGQIHQVQNIIYLKAVRLDSIEKATIQLKTLLVKKEKKTNLNILVNIYTRQNINFMEERIKNYESSTTGGVIYELLDRRNKWKTKPMKLKKFVSSSSYLGCFLALVSSVLCGLSFVLKKRSLLIMNEPNFYLNRGWWMAHLLMVVGDILHFLAFFFTSAVLVCTLQMLLVLVVAVASSKILGEKHNTYWKFGFASSLGGCLIINVHVPKEPQVQTIELFTYLITSPKFVAYNLLLSLSTIIMIIYFIPKWGSVNSLAYVVQSAIFGSLAVVALKGVLLIFTDKMFHWLPLTSALTFSLCLLYQLVYLNKALNCYNTLLVATQYYVLYSALVIMASFVLFEVWKSRSDEAMLVILLGFATTTLGVLIFAIFEEDDATFDFSKLFHGPEIRKS